MNWFKKSFNSGLMEYKKQMDWDTAYNQLFKELGRVPSNEEVRKKMHSNVDKSVFPHEEDTPDYTPLL